MSQKADSKKLLKFIDRAAKEVDRWPAWMKGSADPITAAKAQGAAEERTRALEILRASAARYARRAEYMYGASAKRACEGAKIALYDAMVTIEAGDYLKGPTT